ncbi:MAG: LCP family protein [Chloroflexota bacterium]|jgi:anionic cell wall polymer biosynthesis LytR-Cps2A-Psr (LCP) family protein
MGHRTPPRLLGLLLALVVLAGPMPAGAVTPGTVGAEDGLRVAMDAMRQLATDTRYNHQQKKTTRPKPGLPVKLGKDGRLTVLLVGSDWRENAGGERLDVLMVATIDPTTGRAAVVSIPRDMAGIPLAGGGNSGGMRVNALYYLRYRNPALGHKAIDRKAMKRFSKDIATFLGTEIDYWAMTRFATFANLINSLGGVRIDIEEELIDSSYHQNRSRGVYFPVKDNYLLKGDPNCKPYPSKCHSALVWTRSRKGTQGGTYNSDYVRAERQQQLVRAAVKNILEDGAGIALVGRLLKVRDKIETNIPKTVEAAGQLYAMFEGMKLRKQDMKVLAPATWAYTASDGTTRPNLSRIRQYVDKAFYKVKKAKRKNR